MWALFTILEGKQLLRRRHRVARTEQRNRAQLMCVTCHQVKLRHDVPTSAIYVAVWPHCPHSLTSGLICGCDRVQEERRFNINFSFKYQEWMKKTNQILQTFLNKVAPRVITNLKRMQGTDEGSFKLQWNYYVCLYISGWKVLLKQSYEVISNDRKILMSFS